MNLRAALTNIHRDPFWWRKVLIGGALMLTIIGTPWSAGLVVESLNNARNGYPTPLPPWYNWGDRYLIGFFALILDFVFFVLPVLCFSLLFFCGLTILVFSNTSSVPTILIVGAGSLLVVYELSLFGLSIAPVGRLIYTDEGRIEEALSLRTFREALRRDARAIYAGARLQSLPTYLPALVLLVILWFVLNTSFPGLWLVVLLLLWLILSAFLYAHLVVAQLYAMTARSLGMTTPV